MTENGVPPDKMAKSHSFLSGTPLPVSPERRILRNAYQKDADMSLQLAFQQMANILLQEMLLKSKKFMCSILTRESVLSPLLLSISVSLISLGLQLLKKRSQTVEKTTFASTLLKETKLRRKFSRVLRSALLLGLSHRAIVSSLGQLTVNCNTGKETRSPKHIQSAKEPFRVLFAGKTRPLEERSSLLEETTSHSPFLSLMELAPSFGT